MRSTVLTSILAIAIAGCQQGKESRAGEERKSPFATGNVSVAPQLDGGPAAAPPQLAPTPMPAPRPGTESSPESPQ